MNLELVLGIITAVALMVILSQLKRLNVVMSILFAGGMVVFAGLVITLVAAALGTDSLMINHSNPPW
jgi:activator of 2-hydroxyglutaryl-CoA dehydratase